MIIIRNPISYNMLLLRWKTVKAKTIMAMIATNELEPFIALKYITKSRIKHAYCNKAITTERGGIKSLKQDIVFDFMNVELLEEANSNFSIVDDKVFHVVEKRFAREHEITQSVAAALCGVSKRTIQNWEKDIRRPEKYPGRDDEKALRSFGADYKEEHARRRVRRSLERLIYTDTGKLDQMANTNFTNRD